LREKELLELATSLLRDLEGDGERGGEKGKEESKYLYSSSKRGDELFFVMRGPGRDKPLIPHSFSKKGGVHRHSGRQFIKPKGEKKKKGNGKKKSILIYSRSWGGKRS